MSYSELETFTESRSPDEIQADKPYELDFENVLDINTLFICPRGQKNSPQAATMFTIYGIKSKFLPGGLRTFHRMPNTDKHEVVKKISQIKNIILILSDISRNEFKEDVEFFNSHSEIKAIIVDLVDPNEIIPQLSK